MNGTARSREPGGERPHPILSAMIRALDLSHVRWAVLWAPKGGLAAPQGDVDLVVHPADREAMFAVLSQLAFVRRPSPGPSAHFVQYRSESDRWLWLHVVTQFAFGGTVAFAMERAQVVVPNGTHVPRLDADTSFWVLLWHCLAKRSISPHHRAALHQLSCRVPAGSVTAERFGRACGDASLPGELLDAVRRDSWDVVVAAGAQRVSAAATGPLMTRLRRRGSHLVAAARAWRHGQGVSVALLGPDGAGKSTLAGGICRDVPFPSCAMYMGLTGGAMTYAHRLRLPGLVFAASSIVIWSRYIRARYHVARGRLVVFDRYVYDAVAPHPAPHGTLRRLGRRLSGHLCPPPDLVLILDAPGSVMYARKHAYRAATLERWRRDFLTLRARFPSRVRVVNAAASIDDVRVAALAHIWQRYATRWDRAREAAR